MRHVSRETEARLEEFADQLRKWNPRINLVSRPSLAQLDRRHIDDSAQLFALCPPGARNWLDIGSGGGFPGLVIAILAADAAPQLHVTLVESDQRKAAFLATAARASRVDVTIHPQRAEALPPQAADVLSARALAPLPQLLRHAERHLAPTGRAVFPKGAGHETELTEALASWRFSVQKIPSRTDPAGVILVVEGVTRA